MCKKYHVRPVEYGHWVDSKLCSEKEPWLSTQESYEMLVRDIKLANDWDSPAGGRNWE